MKYCLVDTIPNVPGSMPFLFKVLRDNVGQLEKIVWEDPIIAKTTLQVTTKSLQLPSGQ